MFNSFIPFLDGRQNVLTVNDVVSVGPVLTSFQMVNVQSSVCVSNFNFLVKSLEIAQQLAPQSNSA